MSHVSEWGSGMSYVRDHNNGESYAVIGLAISGDPSVTVSGVRSGRYVDAVTGHAVEARGGTLSFHVRASSAGIYALNAAGKIGEDGIYLR